MRVDRNIYLKVKKSGGMKITFQSPPKIIDEKMISNILRDYKLLNCEVLVRDEYGTFCLHRTLEASCFYILTYNQPATVDDIIDVIMKDHRKYIRW